MAYQAGDTFLPSWGSGMVPREPAEDDEETSVAYGDYLPKPDKLGMQSHVEVERGEEEQEEEEDEEAAQVMQPCLESQMKPYGTMSDATEEESTDAIWSNTGSKDRVFQKMARRTGRLRVAEKSLFLLWWPAFLGLCIVAAFGLKYWHHPWLAWTVFSLTALFGVIMLVIGSKGGVPGSASPTFMVVNGCFVIVLALVSVVLGKYCFETYTKQFEIYRGSRHYENVVSSKNPGASRDAGIIDFAAGAHVDTERSIGIRNGVAYCVAPIIDPSSPTSYVGFWAAGVDCCSARGRFRCGDVSDAQARSGLVVLDENSFDVEEIPEYTKAAEEASAQFALSMPEKPIFVKWTGSPVSDMEKFYRGALSFVFQAAAGLFGFMLVVVMLLSGGGEGFGHAYYSLEVDETLVQHTRGKKGKAAYHGAAFR